MVRNWMSIYLVVAGMVAFGARAQDLPDEVYDVELVTGEVVRGRIVELTDELVVMHHDLLGTLEIDPAHIASTRLIVDEEAPIAPERAAEEQDESEGAAEEDAVPEESNPWTFQLDLSLAGAAGNTESTDARFGFLGRYEDDQRRFVSDAAYYYGTQAGNEVTNKFTAGARHDWLLPESRWFYFVQSRFDTDEFQSWDWRLSTHAGAGYQFYEKEDFKLRGRMGVGGTYEQGSDDDGFHPEALAGLDLQWTIDPRQSLVAHTTVYPRLDDVGEFRWVSGADWIFDISTEHGLSFKVGMFHEYQSEVDPGIKRNDLKAYAGIVYTF